MYTLRKDLGIGVVTPEAGGPEGMLAKCRVADLLDIKINPYNGLNHGWHS